MKQTLSLALVLGLAAAPALAQDRPPMMPSRDVAVTYRMVGGEGGGGAQQIQMSWLVAQGLHRVDMGAGQGWMVSDTRNNRGFMVMERERMVMDMPDTRRGGGPQMGQPGASARMTREGSATVAGNSCTVWKIEDQGRESRACITNDGVMLRVLGRDPATPGRESGMEATQVTFGTQDPARFARPAGFQVMQMPGGMPGGMPPGGPPGGRMR